MLKSGKGRHNGYNLIFVLGLVVAMANSNTFFSLLSNLLTNNSAYAAEETHGLSKSSVFGRVQLAEYFSKFAVCKECLPGSKCLSVCVVGEVVYPGQFELPEPSTALDALSCAGGVAPSGSCRTIKIFRGAFCQEYDLYDFLTDGSDSSPSLSGGETIVVEPVKSLIEVMGMVARPGIYELKPEEKNLSWILKLAGIDKAGKDEVLVNIFRLSGGNYRHIFSEEISPRSLVQAETLQFLLEDNDRIEVSEKNIQSKSIEIELSGCFKHPGKIQSDRAVRLSDFVSSTNLTPDYAPDYAEILRPDPESGEFKVLSFSVESVIEGHSHAEILLKNNDRIVIFSKEELGMFAKVAIEQGIRGKQIFQWRENLRISDLIEMAGGLEKGSGNVAELIRKQIDGGSIQSISVIVDLAKIWSGDKRHDIHLKPFDILLINDISAKSR
jgi:protein involved in polysaccharide export with SLBB domain